MEISTFARSADPLECPQCRRYSVVTKGNSSYVCLNCNWERDVSSSSLSNSPLMPVTLAVTTGLIVLFLSL
jgi:transposase-like protein